MKTKLVSLNIGIQLTVLKDGKEQKMSYSQVCNAENKMQPIRALNNICDYLNETFGTNLLVDGNLWSVLFSKLKIKAIPPALTQEEFNQKIKELIP